MFYTYLIGWSKHNIWYYGVRTAKKCDPSDLWKTYFTSSHKVAQARSLFGEPDIKQIRKTFTDAERAKIWEQKVIRRMLMVSDHRFLNQSEGLGPFHATCEGMRWYTNGETDILCHSRPRGYRLGRTKTFPNGGRNSPVGKTWWTNGTISVRSSEPIEGFKPGRVTFKRRPHTKKTRALISKANKGRKATLEQKLRASLDSKKRKHWTNGTITVFREICPEGFRSGRVMKRRTT